MKEYDEVYQQVVSYYDKLDLEHWYMMHRAGLVHLVSSYFDIPEDIVHCIINNSHGPTELDHAAMDEIKDGNENGSRT